MPEQLIKYRAVIEFLTLEGKSAKQILDYLVIVYGTEAPSLATVYNWRNELQRGRK